MSVRLLARAAAGLGLCAAALSASAYSSLVVFGDSLSDSGNNAVLMAQAYGGTLPPVSIGNDSVFSTVPSAFGTYTNGKVWTQYLAQSLGVVLIPSLLPSGTNYAFGGAQTGLNGNDIPQLPGFPYSMRTQLDSYLSATGNAADPNALYVVSGGGNNVRAALEAIAKGADVQATSAATVAAYAADMAGLVGDLQLAGARHVLVLNTPNFGLTPLARAMNASADATALSWAMDMALASALAGSDVKRFDMFGFLTDTVSAGAASGFSNWTNACAAAVNACDVDTSLFWDAIHPTTLAHQQLAAAVLATAVPEPDVAALLALGLVVMASGTRRRAAVQQG